jgi:hypothetical protein
MSEGHSANVEWIIANAINEQARGGPDALAADIIVASEKAGYRITPATEDTALGSQPFDELTREMRPQDTYGDGRDSLHLLKVARLPALVERGFGRAVEPEDNEIPLAGHKVHSLSKYRSLIARGMPLAEGKVEGRLEHAEDAVGTRPSGPHGVGILSQSSRLCRWSAQRSGTA